MRSDTIKRGFDRAPHRSLLRATGQIASAGDFDKPFVAVCNSYVDIIPPAPTPHTGWLARYAAMVSNASEGAVLAAPPWPSVDAPMTSPIRV